MAPALGLLGPPVLRHPKDSPTTPMSTYEDLPLLQDLKSSLPPLNPLLEFFFEAVAHSETAPKKPCFGMWGNCKPKDLADYAEEAWNLDSLTTMKLIVCLRMMENPNKEAFYKLLMWVHKNHPKTLALNVMVLGALGFFEDLLEILERVLEDSIISNHDPDERKTKAAADDISKARIAIERYQNDPDYRFLHDRISDLFAEVLHSDLSFMASGAIKSISSASKFCPSIDSPQDYKTLICESIAKKMYPRINDHIEYKSVEEPYYTYRVRNRLGDHVLIPLREAIENVKKPPTETDKTLIALETYRKIFRPESEKEEGSIVMFHHCMKLIELFSPKGNMVDMFGNLSIDGGSKQLPHQVVASLFRFPYIRECKPPCGDEASELEWRGLVQEFASQGKLKNCVAVCDMRSSSETAHGEFKDAACLSMGLLISELSENPWKGKIFSFNESPKLKKIEGDDLRSKCEFMRRMECTEKVDFGAIYSRILQIALTEKLSKEQMPTRIFVFTYSDFVTAWKNNWNEEYKEAWASYRKRGFAVPQMVFWNLKDPVAEPEVFGSPVKNRNGGIIMTGFSNILLELFFRGETDWRSNAGIKHDNYRVNVLSMMKFVPKVEHVMNCAISREELKNLLVLD